MAYGEIKVDTITFTDGGIDKSVSISGLVQNPTFSGSITVTGTISGDTLQGQTISGVTVTGTTAQFTSGTFTTLTGTTLQGTTATYTTGSFTSLTGTTTQGTTSTYTTGSFTSLTGTTTQGTTASFTTGTFTTLTGTTTTGTTATFTSGSFTTLTGTTTSGTTASFVTGVFSTSVSGATVQGTAGDFTTITGGVTTITSGVFALGANTLPSISFSSDPNTGIYSPGADQVAISTNGTGRLFVNASGNVELSNNDLFLIRTGLGNGQISFDGTVFSLLSNSSSASLTFGTNSTEAIRIDSSGRLLVGTSSARTNIDYAFGTTTARFQIEQADALPCAAIVSNYDSATVGAPAYLTLARAGSTAIGSTTIVADGNRLGEIDFSGSDGTDFTIAASIRGEVDGTPGANDMPGRLVFSTTADGASSPTERMRIDSSGRVEIGAAIGAGANAELYAKTNTYYQAIYGWADGSGTAYGGVFHASAGNSTQYGVYGYVNTSSIYASGGSLAYSINLNTYAICGYWSGASYWSLYGNGAVGATAFTNISDSRLKDVDSTLTGCLDKLASIQPVKYTWKENSQQRRSMGDRLEIGLLAEEVQAQFPELVSEMEWGKVTGANPETLNEQLGTTLGVDYGRMTAVLIQALNEAKERIETLEARITALETA
jgi:hypothetical protein